jgi:hypothetical protein
MKFTRENDRSLHHFYSFLWNQKHPFLFLGRMMFMSLLPIFNVYQTNYFICKDQHIYTVLYDSKNNVYAILDSNDEQIRYSTGQELYTEIGNAEYIFMELNDHIIPNIITKLDRMENKNETNKVNSQNVRQVVLTYQNSLKHEAEMDPSVIQQRMINRDSTGPNINNNLINDLTKPFDQFDQKLFKKNKEKREPVVTNNKKESVPTAPSVIPSVSIKEPVKKEDSEPTDKTDTVDSQVLASRQIERRTHILPSIIPCDGCPSIGRGSSNESLQERRAKRNMVASKASVETEEERRKRMEKMASVIKEKSEKAEQTKNPDAKSVSYYRKMRTDQKKDVKRR